MTIENANMMVWLTPSMMWGIATGSCRCVSRCQVLHPAIVAASSSSGSMARMPSTV